MAGRRAPNVMGLSPTKAYSFTVNLRSPSLRHPEQYGPPDWIADTAPLDHEHDVTVDVTPSVEFGRSLDETSVNASSVRLIDAETGGVVDAAVSYEMETRTASILPTAPLDPGRPYRVLVRDVRATGGSVMEELYSFRFTTGPNDDVTPPDTTFLRALDDGRLSMGMHFVSTEPGSTLECRFDLKPWRYCTSPLDWGFGSGDHMTVCVRAIDGAGNVDPTPAMFARTEPPINDAFQNAQTITGASGELSSANVGASFEPGEPTVGQGLRGVWYRWTAPQNGRAILDTLGSHGATALSVFRANAA